MRDIRLEVTRQELDSVPLDLAHVWLNTESVRHALIPIESQERVGGVN